jgi:hypothetical protein
LPKTKVQFSVKNGANFFSSIVSIASQTDFAKGKASVIFFSSNVADRGLRGSTAGQLRGLELCRCA